MLCRGIDDLPPWRNDPWCLEIRGLSCDFRSSETTFTLEEKFPDFRIHHIWGIWIRRRLHWRVIKILIQFTYIDESGEIHMISGGKIYPDSFRIHSNNRLHYKTFRI